MTAYYTPIEASQEFIRRYSRVETPTEELELVAWVLDLAGRAFKAEMLICQWWADPDNPPKDVVDIVVHGDYFDVA